MKIQSFIKINTSIGQQQFFIYSFFFIASGHRAMQWAVLYKRIIHRYRQ